MIICFSDQLVKIVESSHLYLCGMNSFFQYFLSVREGASLIQLSFYMFSFHNMPGTNSALPILFGVPTQPTLMKLLIDGTNSTCVSASLFGPHFQMLRLQIPWPVLGSPSATLVGHESMVCGTGNLQLTPANLASAAFLYVPSNHSAEYAMSEQGLKGHGQLCTLDSETINSGFKECHFTCDCSSYDCSRVFLTLVNSTVDLCEISYTP